jgi:DNA-binding PadR family transcriptional regulator
MVPKTLGDLGRRIEQMSGHLLTVNQGALHPVSPKLELQGAITFGGGASENNRRARLSREGRKPFQVETPDWAQTAAIIARFFRAKAED